MTKPMTAIQTALLAKLHKQFGTKKAGGIIPMQVLEFYDWRSLSGLVSRNKIVLLVDADGAVRYNLAGV